MRRVVIAVFPGVQTLDVTGPAEVLRAATLLKPPGYEVTIAARTKGPIKTSTVSFVPDARLEDCTGPLDTLIVAGGNGTRRAEDDDALVDWIADAATRSRRVASVCTGAFLLAKAGLLDGRHATTHWASCADLAKRYPAVTVDPDPIFVRDGNVATSAGVTAGMDLALALVEDDHGRDVALAIARRMVLFLRRPGNQSQFSAPLQAQAAEHDGIRAAQHHATEHPEQDCSVAALAKVALMSERNFARCFTAETGVTPARFVERVRTETARRLLEDTDDGVDAIAAAAGFGTAETMRRTFLRVMRTSPTEYRRRFRAA